MNASPTLSARSPRWKPQAFLPPGRVATPAPKHRVQGAVLLPVSLACTILGLASVAGLFTMFAFGVRTVPLWPAWLGGLVLIAAGRVMRGGW
jgi:hypothetical protein